MRAEGQNGIRPRARRRPALAATVFAVAASCIGLEAGLARAGDGWAVPNFWTPRARLERPDIAGMKTVRVLTDDEFPPLHFAEPDGTPTGLSVELARAACEKLALTCTVQARRFDTLLDALSAGQGDVVAAAVPVTAELRRRFSTTTVYFRFPARFVGQRGRGLPEPGAPALAGRPVGAVAGSAHEAFLRAFFPQASVKTAPDLGRAEAALKDGSTEYLFADGVALALWLGGSNAAGCCEFRGGPYLDSRYFGEGIGFITRKEDEPLRRALEIALQQLYDEGRYSEIYLRSFPISPF